MKKYLVVERPGTFGGNYARIFSSHYTLGAAIKKSSDLCCIVYEDRKKGEGFWGDMFPPIIWIDGKTNPRWNDKTKSFAD